MRRIVSGILGLLIGFGFLASLLIQIGASVQNGEPLLTQVNSINLAFATIFLLSGLWYLISGILSLFKKNKSKETRNEVVNERKEPTIGI